MNQGRLDRIIKLLKRSVSADADGAKVETWTPVCEIWAELMSLSGREVRAAGLVRPETSAVFRVRWNCELTQVQASGDYRIQYDGRFYDITPPIEDTTQPRRTFLLIPGTFTQGKVTTIA